MISWHLLWKDYRQARPALVGCWATLAVLLLLVCVRQLIDTQTSDVMAESLMLVLVAPTLAAMACTGVLIGHERQTRTWNWSSSLPISWSSALSSKTIIWVTSSALMVLSLWLLYSVLLQVCIASGYQANFDRSWIEPDVIIFTVLVVPLEVYVCFALAALLLEDTLKAFVLAAIVVGLGHVLLAEMLPDAILDRTNSGFLLGLILVVTFIAFIPALLLIQAFRWRWTRGQLAELGGLPVFAGAKLQVADVSQRRALWRSIALINDSPGEFTMLLWHGFRTAMVSRIAIVVGTMLLAFTASREIMEAGIVCSTFGATLLGITVFAGDQVMNRYRFLSDRGVRWYKLLFAHAIPPFVFSLIPLMLVGLVWLLGFGPYLRTVSIGSFLAILFLHCSLFLLGIYCGLCVRNPLVSMTLAVGTLIGVGIAFTAASELYFQLSNIPIGVELLVVGSTLIVAIALVFLLRRWLVMDRVAGMQHYVVTLVAAVSIPIFLQTSLIFLAVPNVPWQGLPESDVVLRSNRSIPSLAVDGLQIWDGLDRTLYTTDPSRTSEAVANLMSIAASQFEEQGEGWIQASETLLNRIQEQIDAKSSAESSTPQILRSLIQRTAVLAAFAKKSNQPKLAIQAWKVNAQLLDLVDYSAVDSWEFFDGRLNSMILRNAPVAGWRDYTTPAQLMPQPVTYGTWIHLIKMQATASRSLFLGKSINGQRYESSQIYMPDAWSLFAMRSFLPARWHQERLMAYQLQQRIDNISLNQVDARTPAIDPVVRLTELENRLR